MRRPGKVMPLLPEIPDLPCLRGDAEARAYLERRRWPRGAVRCPHCVRPPVAFPLQPRAGSAAGVRPGLWKCPRCRRQFTVTVGTLLEHTHLPLNVWLSAVYLYFCGPHPCPATELSTRLGISRKAASSLWRRFQYAAGESSVCVRRPASFDTVTRRLLRLVPERRHPQAMARQEARLAGSRR